MSRDDAINASVTLNGRRAVVTGRQLDFARVTALDNGESYEWAWPTVFRIIETRNGAFKS